MSAVQDPSLPSFSATHYPPHPLAHQYHPHLPPPHRPWIAATHTQEPANDSVGHIIFTRQLWQRTMPNGNESDDRVLNKSQAQYTRATNQNQPTLADSRRRASSSTLPSRPQRLSLSPAASGRDSHTPLTPEESPPFRSTRKRTAGIVEAEDKDLVRGEVSSSTSPSQHKRSGSGDSVHVCICQPEPKIPRPRNAFILYRQHHQAQVVAQNPGLANPDISKIIGEQWQNQPPEIKNKWKALAEEEKLRHQQQYPTYRYQPKRAGRRGSLSSEPTSGGEPQRCNKCGGRNILAPSTPFSAQFSGTSPSSAQTPGGLITPVTRTLPVLRDLSLQSPAGRYMGRQFPMKSMSPAQHKHMEVHDDLGPLSPDMKRRRYNGDQHQVTLTRPMAPRYVAAPPPGTPSGPGTPFPFASAPPHPYPPAAGARRESLPGLRGVVSPAVSMAPPPRPGPGYQQHRLSQGHGGPHDRSLTLPPLQTGNVGGVAGAVAAATPGKSVKEQIMSLDFWYKVKVLSQVAPPAPVQKSAPRGPLIAVEGDNPAAVRLLGDWLSETLGKDDELNVKQMAGPVASSDGNKKQVMARYHRLAADWLLKSDDISESLQVKPVAPEAPVVAEGSKSTVVPPSSGRDIDENYDDDDDSDQPLSKLSKQPGRVVARADDAKPSSSKNAEHHGGEKMDIDSVPKPSSPPSSKDAPPSNEGPSSSSGKPVRIIANYSLYASNFFACHIPIEAHARYSPKDHWEWTATQWRSIISPDLTIYVRDFGATSAGGDSGKAVEFMDGGNLFVVKKSGRGEGGEGVEPATLRRLGFEVSEWVRGFGEGASAGGGG